MERAHNLFTAHYQENKDKVFNYLMYRLNFNRELAEDLLMDIVLKAYENFAKFNPEKGSFKTWIFTLAHNHLVNHWRDKKEALSLEALEEEGIVPSVSGTEDEANQNIESRNVARVLSLLKPADRDIITLRYLQDLSYEEIAEVLEKKSGAIRTQLSRSLESFEKMYAKFYSK